MDTVLVAAIITALPAVLVWLTARPWVSARVQRVEYQQKRLALVNSLLNDHKDLLSLAEVEALRKEVPLIARAVLVSSDRLDQERVLAWKRRVWWRRLLAVPRPESAVEWIAVFAFYVYAAGGVAYLVLVPFVGTTEPPWTAVVLTVYCLSCFVVSAAAKSWHVRNSAGLAE